MPRGARLDAPGTLHHVIVRGIERRHRIDTRFKSLLKSSWIFSSENMVLGF